MFDPYTHTHTAFTPAAVELFHTHNTHTSLCETTPDPSPCLCQENECKNERDGNGAENETEKEASGNVEQLWAKIDKLNRGLSDPGLETRQNQPKQANLTDMGAAPGNGENSLRVPVSQPENDNVTAIAEKWSAKFGSTQTGHIECEVDGLMSTGAFEASGPVLDLDLVDGERRNINEQKEEVPEGKIYFIGTEEFGDG